MREEGPRQSSLLVVAGEPSGDRAAAAVVRALDPGRRWSCFGVGGERLADAGVELLAQIRGLTAMGIGEPLRRAAAWGRAWAAIRREARARRPGAALLVDSPEINLPLARVLRAGGIPVVFYVGPQVWAWRPRRLELLGRRTSTVALVLPFEAAIYERAGVRAEFVGHPLLDEPPPRSREAVRAALGIGSAERLAVLLPGSRRTEARLLGPPLIDCARRLAHRGISAILAPGEGEARELLGDPAREGGARLAPVGYTARELLGAGDAALVASGTATLEAALADVPLAVVYRLDWLSWGVARRLVDVPYVGLPNWVAGRRIVPELLQDQVTGASLCEQVRGLLDRAEQRRQRRELELVRRRLGGPGAAGRVAQMLAEHAR